MSIKVNIFYPHLLQATNNQKEVEVNGTTVGQCLDDLVKQFPDIGKLIFAEQGKLLNFINILVNGESILTYSPDPLTKPVKDGDTLDIALMIAGG
jgi:molybdopterin converting factor small subunit